MKSYKFFLVVAAAAAFSACTSDEGIKSSPQNSGEAMTFAVKNKNLSRAGVVGLETVSKDFGVWGYKGDAVSSATTPAVMENYLVGYVGEDAGAGRYDFPAGITTTYGSPWVYENFDATVANIAAGQTKQFLKYWDFSQEHYFFYGYAPYVKGKDTPTFDKANLTLDFGKSPLEAGVAGANPQCSFMYACTRVDKNDYGQYVSMNFKRLYAQTQIGFYEAIPGYTVKILSAYNIPTDMGPNAEAYNNDDGEFGAVAYAMNRTDKGTKPNPIVGEADIPVYNYTREEFIYQVNPKVVFTDETDKDLEGTVTYANAVHTQNPFGWAAPAETAIGTTPETASMSGTAYNVIPVNAVDGEDAVGYRLFVSFQLEAEDTHETINVYNAPVFIPADKVDWKANHLYKYIFKITKNAGGTTSGPNDDDKPINPGEEDGVSLFPIVFNFMTVTDYDNEVVEEFNISN